MTRFARLPGVEGRAACPRIAPARPGPAAAALALFALAAPAGALAQTGTIEGRVLMPDLAPAAGVDVHIHALGRTVVSGDSGQFRFGDVPARRYAIEALSAQGNRGVASVSVRAGALATVEIHLTPLYHLDEVVVSAGPAATQRSDLYQATEVLTGRDLAVQVAGTLGETLEGEAGVSATAFGAGASRPVIRGLGGDRVRVLEGGVDVGDASNTSPDHAVSLEPGMAERIEVIRGPATLLYGASAIGGVVNVLDNRVPTEMPSGAVAGHLSGTAGSGSNELVGQGEVRFATGPLVWSLGGLHRDTDDYGIPGFAERDPEPGAIASGLLDNSAVETTRGSAGVSFVGGSGYLGVAFSGYDSRYGVPGHAHADEEGPEEEAAPIAIDLEQRRLDVEGERRFSGEALTNLRGRFGLTDYRHFELEGAEVGTDFRNEQWEGRLELGTRFGEAVHGAVGVQLGRRDFAVTGEEAFTPPNETFHVALFAFQDFAVGDALGVQGGARFEHRGSRLADDTFERDFDDVSVSLGANWRATDLVGFAVSAARSVKAPTPEELFSDGPHAATRSFEVGDRALEPEVGWSVDGTVRLDGERFSAEATGFVNDFDGFLYLAGQGAEIDGLPVFAYSAADARFAGFESVGRVELFHRGRHHVGLRALADYVRAELTDTGEPLPRIPPFRLGGGLSYDGGALRAGIDVRRSWAQDRVAEFETPTAAFVTADAQVSYRLVRGGAAHDVIVRVRNLADEEVRLHTSFLKDEAPLPGRDVRLVYRLTF